ncbi:MAG: glycosyltransferase family 4 protein [Paludibacter sp.]
MKILFILHYPPPIHGAAAVGLQIKESELINKTFSCKYINLGTSRTIDEIGGKSVQKLFRYLAIIWQVLIQLVFNRPDLCYLSITSKGVPFYKDATLVLLAKLFGVKLVYHFHNKGVSLMQDRVFDNLLYKFVFKKSNVILLSEKLYPDIQKYVSLKQIHFCPNGIPDMEILTVDKKEDGRVSLLFLSNLLVSKGVFVLLEACRVLKNKNLNFECVFVGGIGDINQQQFEEKLKDLDLADCVKYEGRKIGKEKAEAFATADIFVHPTLDDCFPLVLLEAMQYSLPVVSTLEGGVPDIVVNNATGYLVEKANVETLAGQLEMLIKQSELRKRFGSAGRGRYENEFKIQCFENRLHKILQTLTVK